MNIKSRDEYIMCRFKRAEESLEVAQLLVANNKWNAAINRLYYACFYGVISLLLKNNISTQTHDGSRTQFALHFVKTGVIEKTYGKLYSKLFDLRQKGDYGDLYDFDAETVEPLLAQTEAFVTEIRKHLFPI